MTSNKYGFTTGLVTGILSSFAVIGVSYTAYNFYETYQTKQLIQHVEQQHLVFVDQLNQKFLNKKNNNTDKIMTLMRQNSEIRSQIMQHLATQDGLSFDFNQFNFEAKFLEQDNIPKALQHQKIYYQPVLNGEQLRPQWQCYSSLPDDLRPKNCRFSQEAPRSFELLKAVLLSTRSSKTNTYTPPISNDCTKFKAKLPEQFDIIATGAYSGRSSNYQIDDSGHQAHEMDINVQHDRPLVLMLGAYEPSIWRIKWTPNTKIVGVVATGYHQQKVLGLPQSVPLLTTTSDNAQCGYSYVSNDNASQMNQLAQKIMQRDIQSIVLAQDGRANIGKIRQIYDLQSSNDQTLEDIIDRNVPLAGKAGIDDAVAKGLLRPATKADFQAWKVAHNKANNIHTPPVIGANESSSNIEYVHLHNSYVVLKEMTIPAGLYGAHSVSFFVPQGVARPKGNLGHSEIYDMNAGNCVGASPNCAHE